MGGKRQIQGKGVPEDEQNMNQQKGGKARLLTSPRFRAGCGVALEPVGGNLYGCVSS